MFKDSFSLESMEKKELLNSAHIPNPSENAHGAGYIRPNV
jgi:hypothetical protein